MSLRRRFLKRLTDFYTEAENVKTEKELIDLIKKQRILTLAMNLKYDRGPKTFYDMYMDGHNVTETTFLTVEDVANKIEIGTHPNFNGGISKSVSVFIEISDDVLYSFTKDVIRFFEIDINLANKIATKRKLLE